MKWQSKVDFPQKNECGLSILEPLIAIFTISLFFVMMLSAQESNAARLYEGRSRMLAGELATELLEFFRGHSTRELKTYLRKNPISGETSVAQNYYACAHINILDRENAAFVNEDPIVTFNIPAHWNRLQAALQPNRFYQVHIVNGNKPENVRTELCSRKWLEIKFPGEADLALSPDAILLGPNDRFLVTVGVSWVPAKKGAGNATELLLSALIPEAYAP